MTEHPPALEHRRVQERLVEIFDALATSHGFQASANLRIKMADGRIRVADVAVFRDAPPDPLPTKPPLVVIDVLSDDRWNELIERLHDFQEWRVPNIWLVDTNRRELMIYRGWSIVPAKSLTLPFIPFEIRCSDLG